MLRAAAHCCVPAATAARGTKAGTCYKEKKTSRQQAGRQAGRKAGKQTGRQSGNMQQMTGDGYCRCRCRYCWLWLAHHQ